MILTSALDHSTKLTEHQVIQGTQGKLHSVLGVSSYAVTWMGCSYHLRLRHPTLTASEYAITILLLVKLKSFKHAIH